MPSTPIILLHSEDPTTGLTRCGHAWGGDTYRGYQHWPRIKCPGCLAALEAELFSKPRYCR